MPITYEPIATNTLGSAAASVTFSSISGAYTDLVITMSYSRSVSGNGLLRFNSDSGSNYSHTYLLGDGSSASSSRGSNQTNGILSYDSASLQETCIVNIFNYSNTTTYKTFYTRGNDTGLGVISYVNLWRSTSAITDIELRPNSGNWNSGSMFTLFGIKAA
jgi:hypothetical protein